MIHRVQRDGDIRRWLTSVLHEILIANSVVGASSRALGSGLSVAAPGRLVVCCRSLADAVRFAGVFAGATRRHSHGPQRWTEHNLRGSCPAGHAMAHSTSFPSSQGAWTYRLRMGTPSAAVAATRSGTTAPIRRRFDSGAFGCSFLSAAGPKAPFFFERSTANCCS